MIAQFLRQILAVIRLELRKTFFARRGLWIYLLALAPVILFVGRSIQAPRQRQRLAAIAAAHPLSSRQLSTIHRRMTKTQIVEILGQPYSQRVRSHRVGEGRFLTREFDWYTDGKFDYSMVFENDILMRDPLRTGPGGLAEDKLLFASVFQFFFLRLAVFFGCVGIFVNLFRGELLDKSLHFYLLTPIRREALVIGKYLAGLIATTVIFCASAAGQLLALLSQYHHLGGAGLGDFGAYIGVTALACIGYGSIFLAAGVFFFNPIVSAAVILIWESINLFLPATIQKFSLMFYLRSVCPTVPPADSTLPIPLAALISSPELAKPGIAIVCVLAGALALVGLSAIRARRLEINYGAD